MIGTMRRAMRRHNSVMGIFVFVAIYGFSHFLVATWDIAVGHDPANLSTVFWPALSLVASVLVSVSLWPDVRADFGWEIPDDPAQPGCDVAFEILDPKLFDLAKKAVDHAIRVSERKDITTTMYMGWLADAYDAARKHQSRNR
tara:strand:+ start:712 stop:1140 length:429 start_codon:yes stop_codon:yes gene_type:complete